MQNAAWGWFGGAFLVRPTWRNVWMGARRDQAPLRGQRRKAPGFAGGSLLIGIYAKIIFLADLLNCGPDCATHILGLTCVDILPYPVHNFK